MKSEKQGLVGAIVIHVAFFTCIGLFLIFQNFFKPKPPEVLTLVSSPSQTNAKPIENSVLVPKIEVAELPPIESKPLPEIPKAVEPPPPKPVVSKPKPKPILKPKPKTQKISAADFFKTHGKPKVKTTKTVSRPKTVAPKLNVDKVTNSLDKLANSQTVSNSDARLRNYLKQLQRQIELQWHRPQSFTGNTEWAEVKVNLAANGRILSFDIISKHGDAEFIRTVQQAVKNAHSIGPTPNGQPMAARFTFRLREE